MVKRLTLFCCTISFLLGCSEPKLHKHTPELADIAIINGVIYTAESDETDKHTNSLAQALSIKGDKILAVGSNEKIQATIGPATQIIDAHGNTVLPGLHDIHIHPFGLISSSQCDLESEPLDLEALSATVQACIKENALADGEWLSVEQWNFTKGNKPSEKLQSIRQALDAASTSHPIYLAGNDGHHGAANSLALASAKSLSGEVVGLSGNTLKTHFSDYKQYVGIDAQGEPNGHLSETARYLLNIDANLLTGDGTPEQLANKLPDIVALLNSKGITSIQDAAADINTFSLWESFADSGQQTLRMTAALFTDFTDFSRTANQTEGFTSGKAKFADSEQALWVNRGEQQEVNISAVIAEFSAIKARQTNTDILKADAAKVFVDGVIEGNPYATPASLPNAAVYQPYHQPQFRLEKDELLLTGYQSPEVPSTGKLEHNKRFIQQYIEALESAGFAVHAHAIGDRAVGTALDIFKQSRLKLQHNIPQTIAHAQQIAPTDLAKLSNNPVFFTFTYAWAVPDYLYDVTVTPFIDKLDSLNDLYRPENYAMQFHYPVNSAKQHGAILTAGSDAPVDTRDPRPFANIAAAVTRAAEGKIYNANERITITDALDAYTINGAKALRQDHITGSLKAGKKADIIILDRNLFAGAQTTDPQWLSSTRVTTTLFDGQIVFNNNN